VKNKKNGGFFLRLLWASLLVSLIFFLGPGKFCNLSAEEDFEVEIIDPGEGPDTLADMENLESDFEPLGEIEILEEEDMDDLVLEFEAEVEEPVVDILEVDDEIIEELDEEVEEEVAEEEEKVMPVTKVSLDFKEADIRNVLRILSYKSGTNIVASPEVTGMVTIRLTDVPWDKALEVILDTYGYGYEKKENIITVYPMEMLTARKREEQELAAVQPTITKVVTLKFVDALDMKKALDPQLSPRGRITVLEMTGQAGWRASQWTAPQPYLWA